jgi:hypothetical protein
MQRRGGPVRLWLAELVRYLRIMKRFSWAVSRAIVLLVLTLCATWFMRSCARMPGEAAEAAAEPAVELAKRVVDGISRRLQFRPEVRIDQVTVLSAEMPVLELAAVRREFAHEYLWEEQWLGSTKRLHLRGTFAVKAGVDLHEKFYLEIDSHDLRVKAEFAEPRVLGVELLAYRVEEEEGLWNRLSAVEREQAVNALLVSARAAAARDGKLTADARRMLEAQISAAVIGAGGLWRPEVVEPKN